MQIIDAILKSYLRKCLLGFMTSSNCVKKGTTVFFFHLSTMKRIVQQHFCPQHRAIISAWAQ